MPKDTDHSHSPVVVPISGRRLALPPGPIFHLCRAGDTRHEIGEFRAWAGYKSLGSEEATNGLAHFQHVVSFADTQTAGRTGVHAHLAHARLVIPTSGRGVFSYDGVATEAGPGTVIVQHGGTVHDQFDYSFSGASEAENRLTPLSVEPAAPGAPVQSFSFLELFVPKTFANVEIVPPAEVTAEDERTAWDHPYHLPGAGFFLQTAHDPAAAFHPLAGCPGIEVRDAQTWAPSAGLVATWILRASAGAGGADVVAVIPGEVGGLDLLYLVSGAATFAREDGGAVRLLAGDCLTASAGLVAGPTEPSPDFRLVKIFISAAAEALHERTAAEIARLEALGPAIITEREVRPPGDVRPVNALRR